MEKLLALIKKLGIELTTDQTAQIREVAEKEFVPAADHAAQKTKLDELTKQLSERDKDLEKLKTDANRMFAQLPQKGGTDAARQWATGNKSEELAKQLEELKAKYKTDTDDLNAKLAGQVKYTGGDIVKIPTLSTTGLGDYDRNTGYPKGGVSVKYQSKTMTQDRGTSFLIDRIEVDESGFIATAASAAAIFQREHVIPEVDAYRYSRIYQLAKAKGYVKEYTPAASTILSALQKDVTEVRDSGAGAADLVIIMPYPVADTFDKVKRTV